MLTNKKKQIQALPVEYTKATREEVLKALNESNEKKHIALSLLAK